MLGILSAVTNMLDPVSKLIDTIHPNEIDRVTAKTGLLQIQADLMAKAMAAEQAQFEAQARIIEAEAKGEGVLQRNWRPITMLTFVFIMAWNYVIAPLTRQPYLTIPPDMWTLLQLGLGGYIAGRSVEKVVPGLVDLVNNKRAQDKDKDAK